MEAMLRVSLGEAVPVLLAVVVAVEVTVVFIVLVPGGEREIVVLPVELREGWEDRVGVPLCVAVLDAAPDRL